MFIMMPVVLIILIYLAAALLPAFILLRYVYRKDVLEKESGRLLRSLILRGVSAALLSIILETIGQRILTLSRISPYSPLYYIILCFLVIAAVEEGTKYYLMKKRTWNDPEFDYTFDAIVYSVFVSLGFAAFENIGYIFNYGLSVALPRAFLSIPGHMGFAVVFGCYYAKAKKASLAGDEAGSRDALLRGYISSVLLHGFYDACAMIGTGASFFVFLVFIVVFYRRVFRLVKQESLADQHL